MSQSWIRGPVCGVDNCRSTLYRLNAGRKFCQFGHIMEGSVEFDDDDGDNYVQTRRLNILLTDTGFGSSASATPSHFDHLPSKVPRRYGHEGRLLHIKCLQSVLCKILPLLMDKAFPRIDSTKRRAFLRQVAALLRVFWLRYAKSTYSYSRASVLDLYILIYLAIRRINRYPLYASDLLALLKVNAVPFVNAAALVPQTDLDKMSIGLFPFLSPSRVPLRNHLYDRIIAVADMVDTNRKNWAVHLDYFYPAAFRVFVDLRLDACQLLTVFYRVGVRITLGRLQMVYKETGLLPEVQFVALLFFVIKLYFVGSPNVPSLQTFLDTLALYEPRLPFVEDLYHAMKMEDVVALDEDSTVQYFQWVYAHLTPEPAKNPAAEDSLPVMKKRLYDIFRHDITPSDAFDLSLKRPEMAPVEENTLLDTDIAQLEKKLSSYICCKFGLKSLTLHKMVLNLDRKFYNTLREDRATIDNTW